MNKVKGTNEDHMQFEREEERIATNKKMNRDVDFDRPKWRDINFITGFLFTCIAFLLIPSLSHGQKTNPQILILNSYHQGFEWSDNELSGLMGRLRQEYPTIDAYIEHLDAKRFPMDDHLLRMKDYLIDKHRGRKIDLVITLDDPALEFALRHRDRLFSKVPIVFAGINNFNPDMLKGQEKVTGVAEFQDIAGTLKVALKLHPYCKEMLAIHDYTSSGLATRQAMEPLLPEFQSRVNIRFTPPATFNEVLDQLKSLPPNALAIILSFATDSSGKSLPLDESTRTFTSIPSVPAYSLNEPRLGHGIVGGFLISGKEQGQRAGDIALRILSGEDPSTIPVDTQSSSLPKFDYHQLVKFHIPLKSLPEESIIINRPESFYEKYRYLVMGTLAVVLTLTLVVALLTWTIIRRRRAEEALRKNEEKYRILVESTDDLVCKIDRNFRYLFANNKYLSRHGLTAENLIGRTYYEFHTEEVAKLLKERLNEVFETGKSVTYENKDEQDNRYFIRTLSPIKGSDGKIIAVISISKDITKHVQIEVALRETKNLLEKIFASLNDAVFIIDNITKVIISCNPAAERIFQYKQKDLIGQKTECLHVNQEMQEKFRKTLHPTVNKGDVLHCEYQMKRKDGSTFISEHTVTGTFDDTGKRITGVHVIRDITERKQTEEQRDRLISELQKALSEVKTLQGFLPICSHCKKIRDDKGYWNQIESYIHKHSDAKFSHGICPECAKKYYPDMDLYSDEKTQQ